MRLVLVPITFDAARRFVSLVHRHHPPPSRHKFSIAAVDETGELRGVCIVGRPVSRVLAADGKTLEVLRVATDGTANACSFLYAAAWRACRALGHTRLISYILDTEPGTSLRASGWRRAARVRGRTWSCPSRIRDDKHPLCDKQRWEICR